MRPEFPGLIELARRLLDTDEPATLATLFSASGSSYRSLGAMMVGGPPGIAAGGVSGGCLEEYIARHGRELTRDRPAVLLSFDTGTADDLEDAKPVLGCGSSIQILIERLQREHLDHLLRLAAAYDAVGSALGGSGTVDSCLTVSCLPQRAGVGIEPAPDVAKDLLAAENKRAREHQV